MKQLLHAAVLVTILGGLTITSQAQTLVVTADPFETYLPGAFAAASPFGNITSVNIVAGAGVLGTRSAELTGTLDPGFGIAGFTFSPFVQPVGTNTSTNLADYTLSFDLKINTALPSAFEAQLFNNNNSAQGLLLSVDISGTTSGVYQHFAINLASQGGDDLPFGKTVIFDPTTQSISIATDSLGFGLATATSIQYDLDNVLITTIPEPTTYAMMLLGGIGILVNFRRRRVA